MLKIYNGTSWVTIDKPLIWDGTKWSHRGLQYWDGLEWQNQQVLSSNYSTSALLAWNVAAPTVPPAPPTQTYTATKSFAAVWSGAYKGSGSLRTDKTDLYQGYVDSNNGNQKSLIGFSVTGIPAGATIVSATMTLYASHWYNNSGGTAVIGTHINTSKPGTWTGANPDVLRYAWNTKTGSRTITLGNAIGAALLSGSAKGICLGPGPTSGSSYYGFFEGTGSLRPTLTLKYQYVA